MLEAQTVKSIITATSILSVSHLKYAHVGPIILSTVLSLNMR
jgi:hypothetical protein